MVSEGSAKPIFRDPHDRRQLVTKPKCCFDNGPIRLLVQTRPRTLSGNPELDEAEHGPLKSTLQANGM